MRRQRHERVEVAELARPQSRGARRSSASPARSILFTTSSVGVATWCTSVGDEPVARRRSGASRRRAGRRRRPRRACATARWLVRSPSSVRGLWMPGVSRNTIWLSCRRAHAPDLAAGRLRPVGDDRDLRADELVHQRRLPDVGPADERDEPAPEARGRRRSATATGLALARVVAARRSRWERRIRTLTMRRPGPSRCGTRAPGSGRPRPRRARARAG